MKDRLGLGFRVSGGQAGISPHLPAGLPDPQGVERDVQHPRHTHETAAVYRSPPEGFDPERFGTAGDDAGAAVPFIISRSAAVRAATSGQELAQTVLQLLAVELVRTARWELATPAPAMQTVPIVHPVDGLRLFPPSCVSGGAGWATPLTCCAVEPGLAQRLRRSCGTAHLPVLQCRVRRALIHQRFLNATLLCPTLREETRDHPTALGEASWLVGRCLQYLSPLREDR